MPRYEIFKSRSPKFSYLIIAVVLVLALFTGVAVMRKAYSDNLKAVNSSEKSQLVTIPSGAGAKQIAGILEEKKLIRAGWAFEWYVRNSDMRDNLQAGTYAIKPSQDVKEIVTIMTQGHIATDLVTVLPGKRIDQLRDNLINDGFEPQAVDASFDPKRYANHPALVDKPAGASLEGYLYPESFQRTAETKPEDIVRQSLDQMQKYLTPEVRAGIIAQGFKSIHEGVILASIIEREVDKAEDKPVVAQVFIRRLRSDIALESDATASYGAVLDGAEPRPGYSSPYNTYQNKGLTPGPISNVSKASLYAVANPSPTDFLYFVSGDDKTTHFSHTLEEHEAKVRQYCTKLCNR